MAEEKLNKVKSAVAEGEGGDQKQEKAEEEKEKEEVKDSADSQVMAAKPEASKAKVAKPEVKPEEKKEEVAEVKEEKAEKPKEKPKPSGKYKEIIEKIEKLSILELSELVKELEDRFGVSAATPMAVASPATPAASAEEGGEATAPSKVTLILADSGAQKIAVIKALREINPDLGLKEAKDIADAAPKEVKKDIPREEAEEAKKKLEAAGAKVELK
jgi:large subunit ribosomal protein L7/L12